MGWFSKRSEGGKKEMGMKVEGGMSVVTPSPGTKTAKDPVCGMEVNTDRAAATSVYQGQTFYFCAIGCKKVFDENPAKYTQGGGHKKAGHGGHGM